MELDSTRFTRRPRIVEEVEISPYRSSRPRIVEEVDISSPASRRYGRPRIVEEVDISPRRSSRPRIVEEVDIVPSRRISSREEVHEKIPIRSSTSRYDNIIMDHDFSNEKLGRDRHLAIIERIEEPSSLIREAFSNLERDERIIDSLAWFIVYQQDGSKIEDTVYEIGTLFLNGTISSRTTTKLIWKMQDAAEKIYSGGYNILSFFVQSIKPSC